MLTKVEGCGRVLGTMRATIALNDELERIARAKAGAERKILSDIVNEALLAYLPKEIILEFNKTNKTIKITERR